MASVTSPDNIVFPDGGDTYTVPGVLGSMADTIQDALTEKANYGVGTSAEMNAALNRFPNGAVWFNTTDNVQYRRVSGVWVPNPGSNYGVGPSTLMASSLGSFPDGALWYNTTDSTEYRKVAGAWVPDDTGWVNVTPVGGWTQDNSVQVRKIGGVVYWRGRITPSSSASGRREFFPEGRVPVWARPGNVYESLRPVASSFSNSATVNERIKSAAIYPDGSGAAFFGSTASTDTIILSGLSGYIVD